MEALFSCCFFLAVIVIAVCVTAFALQAACVFLDVPPITFGQAVAMTLLDAILARTGSSAIFLFLRRQYRPEEPPLWLMFPLAVGLLLAGFALSGWLYSKFFDGVRFLKGVIVAIVAAVVQMLFFGAIFGALLALRVVSL